VERVDAMNNVHAYLQ